MQMIGVKGARLSRLQERLWGFLRENHVYQVQCAVSLEGWLERKALQDALQQLVDQHEILRTVYYCLAGMNIPVQVIKQNVQISCPIIDMEGFDQTCQSNLIAQCFTHIQNLPFELESEPQVRTLLFHLSNARNILFVSLPALSADAVTLSSFIVQWARYYQVLVNDLQPLQEEEPLQYIDLSAWLEELLLEDQGTTQQEFLAKN